MPTLIAINNSAVNALLDTLQQRTSNMSPVLMAIGEDIMERTKQRFSAATAPDGTPWAVNSQVTLANYLRRASGEFAGFSHLATKKQGSTRLGDKKGYYKKDGSLSKKSQTLLANKRPLIGEGGALAQQFHTQATGTAVVVGSSAAYAAMQQYGGKKSQFPNLWGDIPARPFLPVMANGDLYPQEEAQILDMLQVYLSV